MLYTLGVLVHHVAKIARWMSTIGTHHLALLVHYEILGVFGESRMCGDSNCSVVLCHLSQ